MRRDGNDGCVLGNGAGNELLDVLVLLLSDTLLSYDQIDFVLNDYDVLQLHDFNSRQVLTGLWLRAWLVSGDQKERRVHDSGTSKHGCHQDIMAWAIHEGDVSNQEEA